MPHDITGQHKAEESVAALSNLNIASHEAWHMNKLPEAYIHLQDRKETTANNKKRAQGATSSNK